MPVLDPVKIKRRPARRSRIEEALTYRAAMPVTTILQLKHGDQYPVCPRCNLTLEREYQAYCDRCGQHLSWKGFGRAKIKMWVG